MNLQKLKQEIESDEGKRLDAYVDTTGNLTVGIGHKVYPCDKLKLGDVITDERCNDLFELDLSIAIDKCYHLISGFTTLPDEVKQVLINMAFNLGIYGLLEFHKMINAVMIGDYNAAADEIVNSKAYRQCPTRYKRLSDLMRSTGGKE